MIDLEKISGLPIQVDQNSYELKFNQPLKAVEPNPRTLKEMRTVLLSPDAHISQNELYYMYRNVHFPDHTKLIEGLGLTYDITVIPPYMLGNEFNKTQGHYHANKEGSTLAYPEVYEVLNGKGLFLLQKMDPDFNKLISVVAIEAKAGDKIIYPPNYGHIIINIGSEVLVTANWVAHDFERMYKPVTDFRGLGYYVVKNDKAYTFVPNPQYKDHPPVRQLTNQYMHSFNIMDDGPMYLSGTNNPKNLEFLTEPQKYAVELSSITS